MTATNGLFLYTAFGLQVRSEIALPELFASDGMSYTPESGVTVKRSSLKEAWQEHAGPEDYFAVLDSEVLFSVPEVGLFAAEGGHTIHVSPSPGVAEERLRLYILGTGMGLILLQKRILPLHGSCIAVDGRAYAIVGQSGAGKSTLSSVLLDRGYKLLSDDVIPIVLSDQGPFAFPSYPQQKLWQESLDALEIFRAEGRPIYNRETKFAVPAHDHFHREPLPLAGVFELVKTDDDPFINPVPVMERYYLLFDHTYRNFYVNRGGLMTWHFSTLSKFVNRIDVYRIGRSTKAFSARESADRILKVIYQEGQRDE